MNDIVKRLRWRWRRDPELCMIDGEAADEIEQLRAALKEIARGKIADDREDWLIMAGRLSGIARRALEGK